MQSFYTHMTSGSKSGLRIVASRLLLCQTICQLCVVFILFYLVHQRWNDQVSGTKHHASIPESTAALFFLVWMFILLCFVVRKRYFFQEQETLQRRVKEALLSEAVGFCPWLSVVGLVLLQPSTFLTYLQNNAIHSSLFTGCILSMWLYGFSTMLLLYTMVRTEQKAIAKRITSIHTDERKDVHVRLMHVGCTCLMHPSLDDIETLKLAGNNPVHSVRQLLRQLEQRELTRDRLEKHGLIIFYTACECDSSPHLLGRSPTNAEEEEDVDAAPVDVILWELLQQVYFSEKRTWRRILVLCDWVHPVDFFQMKTRLQTKGLECTTNSDVVFYLLSFVSLSTSNLPSIIRKVWLEEALQQTGQLTRARNSNDYTTLHRLLLLLDGYCSHTIQAKTYQTMHFGALSTLETH